jgi:hypothetical protein
MAIYTTEIIEHPVFNELDSQGLALGLKRLPDEKNAEYKQRLLDVFINKSNCNYRGLINGITRKLGFSFTKEFTIIPKDISTYPNAAIFFKDVRCCIYPDYYGTPDTLEEIDRWDLKVGGGYTLQDLKDKIESYPYFKVILEEDTDLSKRSMLIYDQDSVKTQDRESLVGKGTLINLKNINLFEKSEYITSSNLYERITDADATLKNNQYRIDYVTGKIECGSIPASQSFIRYEYRNDELEIFSSPVFINNLQSEEVSKKIFEQVLQSDDVRYENGAPTVFGADIINELFSVYPTTFKV